jgi:hypothetical protein
MDRQLQGSGEDLWPQMSKKMLTKKVVIKFRVSEYDANKIRAWADIYFEGNLSEFIRFATINSPKRLRAPPKKREPKKIK